MAAGSSFVAFSIGAFIPLAPFLFGAKVLPIAAVLALVALFVTGAITSRFTTRTWWYAGSRQLLVGLLSAAVTYGIGYLFGTTAG
jgi:VIT1/CCC1 family predicted Fe2+/Mn2+ transporter